MVGEVSDMWKSPITEVWEEILQDGIKSHDEYVIKELRSHIEVDLDELKKALAYDRDQYNEGYADGKLDAVTHGHWTDRAKSILGLPTEACSECAEWSVGHNKNYCPNCGAKMDEVMK